MKHILFTLPLLFASAADAQPRKVAIVVYDRAEILDFAGPAEVLAAAGHFAQEDGKPGLDVYLVGKTTQSINAQGFISITPQYSIDTAPKPDIVVIPGGMSSHLSDDDAMMKWLTTTTSKSEATLTVCTGAMPLAKAGSFDGLEITTWYNAVEALQAAAPKARVEAGRRFIDNGRYITTAGVSAGIDGALHLVARTFGRRVADQTARYMEYRWTPEPYLAKAYAYWNPSTTERGRALQMAEAATEEKRWPAAIDQYKKLLTDDPLGTVALALGNTYAQLKDYKRATEAFMRVRPKSPVYATAMYNLACAYALNAQKSAALAALKTAFAAGISRDMALGDPDLVSIKADI